MSVAVMVVGVVQLGLAADVYSLLIELVHVIEESQIVVCVLVVGVQSVALLQVLNCLVVLLQLEVRETQVILQLSIVRIYELCSCKGSQS